MRTFGEQEVRAHARVETRFRSRRGIRASPSRLLVFESGSLERREPVLEDLASRPTLD
ncbi:MAG: hypothetical protein JO342_07590 [Solirubrobacterales bacterium]|nr:hypothetical protein [Solirubrobacterales bacterium]MBV9166000.1 hypothetical protein [Solirubrobacterales bacterium]